MKEAVLEKPTIELVTPPITIENCKPICEPVCAPSIWPNFCGPTQCSPAKDRCSPDCGPDTNCRPSNW